MGESNSIVDSAAFSWYIDKYYLLEVQVRLLTNFGAFLCMLLDSRMIIDTGRGSGNLCCTQESDILTPPYVHDSLLEVQVRLPLDFKYLSTLLQLSRDCFGGPQEHRHLYF